MHRFSVLSVLLILAAAPMVATPTDDVAGKEEELASYEISGKLIRKTWLPINGKDVLDIQEIRIPKIIALQGTLAEYQAGGKLGSTPYGFRLQVEVTPQAKEKVRLALMAEDSSATQNGFLTSTSSTSLRCIRHVVLGTSVKLALDEKDKGEGAWVELSVRLAQERATKGKLPQTSQD